MSSDGGDGDDTVYGYLPGSIEPYVSSQNVQPINIRKERKLIAMKWSGVSKSIQP